MPFEPGHKKSGGRPKGRRNNNSIPLVEKAKELGVDPFEILLLFAKGDWKKLGYPSERFKVYSKDCVNEEYTIQPQVRAKAAAEACQYLYPKLKAIDHKMISDKEMSSSSRVFEVKWADEEPNQNEASNASSEED